MRQVDAEQRAIVRKGELRAVPDGLEKTFAALASTKNEAATAVLLAALDAADRDVQSSALKALVQRRSASGHLELLKRWNTLGKRAKASVAEYGGRMSSAVRSAILSADEELAVNGFDAVLCLCEFDLIPVLIAVAQDKANPTAERAAQTTLFLAETLYEQFAAPRDYRNRRDPQLVRMRVLGALERVLQRSESKMGVEIAEAFLLLVKSDNSNLKRILQDPHDKAYLPIVDLLTHSPRPGVQRLLLSYLEETNAPTTILSVISRRCDVPFVRHLLQQLEGEVSKTISKNLKRIEFFSWLGDDLSLLAALNDDEQSGALHLVMSAGVNRLKRFEVVRFILQHGGLHARRVAAEALRESSGFEANELITQCTTDPDPIVQAHAIRLFRDRGIPGALQRLIECVDSPHKEVRTAARECLSEFTFERFLTSYDMLDEDVKNSTGRLVKRIDADAVSLLQQEFATPSRTRRLRAVAMAASMQVVSEVEDEVIELLSDPDYFLRAEAIRTLAQSDSPDSRTALRECLLDTSAAVREAAEQTLQWFAQADQSGSADLQDVVDLPPLPQVPS